MVVVEQPHSPNGGSEIKYRARPNRLWGHPKGPLGGPGPHLSSPILPRFRPERRKSLFWPSGAGTPPVGQKKSAKKAPNPNQRRGWPEGMLKWPWAPLGPWAEPLRQCIPLHRTKTHHNAHARRSGHAVAEPAMLARSPYRAAGPSFGFVLTPSMRPSMVPKGLGVLHTAHWHVRWGEF